MGQIALLPRHALDKAVYLNEQSIPTRYMEDFTLLGFTVDQFEVALQLLVQNKRPLNRTVSGAQLEITTAKDIQEIAKILKAAGVAYEFGDVADCIYQA